MEGTFYICSCYLCSSAFTSVQALASHLASAVHPPCPQCHVRCRDKATLETHLSLRHPIAPPQAPPKPASPPPQTRNIPQVQFACGDCGRAFGCSSALNSHQQTKKHGPGFPACTDPTCKQRFISSSALRSHQEAKRHGPYSPRGIPQISVSSKEAASATSFHCLECNKEFKFANGLNDHLKMKIHKARPATSAVNPNTCDVCNKTFKSAGGLRSHKKSKVHKPLTPGLECLRPGCGKKFSSPSAMLQHIESGHCSPEITRQTVNSLILEHDHKSIITDKALRDPDAQQRALLSADKSLPDLLTDNSSDESDEDAFEVDSDISDDDTDEGVILTPTTPIADTEGLGTTLSALAISPPNSGRKCARCPHPNCQSRTFHSAKALQLHLSSAAHAPKIFHCPVSLFSDDVTESRSKKREHLLKFSTLSGLTQHLESEACKGGRNTFIKVVKFVEDRLKEFGMESAGLRMLTDGTKTLA